MTVVNIEVQAAFEGYSVARANHDGQLRRYSPDRPLPAGLMGQINAECLAAGESALSEAEVRIVLRVVGGSPT